MKVFLILSCVILAASAAPTSGGQKTKRHLLNDYYYDAMPMPLTYHNALPLHHTYGVHEQLIHPSPVVFKSSEQVVYNTPEVFHAQHLYPQVIDPIYSSGLYSSKVLLNADPCH